MNMCLRSSFNIEDSESSSSIWLTNRAEGNQYDLQNFCLQQYKKWNPFLVETRRMTRVGHIPSGTVSLAQCSGSSRIRSQEQIKKKCISPWIICWVNASWKARSSRIACTGAKCFGTSLGFVLKQVQPRACESSVVYECPVWSMLSFFLPCLPPTASRNCMQNDNKVSEEGVDAQKLSLNHFFSTAFSFWVIAFLEPYRTSINQHSWLKLCFLFSRSPQN